MSPQRSSAKFTRSYRAVVVDDVAPLRRMIVSALLASGRFESVVEASNGLEGVSIVESKRLHLAVLDLSMPVMDGATALPLMLAADPTVTVVIFSGFEHLEMRPALMIAGAAAFVEKGTSLKTLVHTIVTLLDARSGEGGSCTKCLGTPGLGQGGTLCNGAEGG